MRTPCRRKKVCCRARWNGEGVGRRRAGAEEMAGDVKRRKVSGAAAPFTAVPVGSFSPCWGEAEDVGTSFPVFLASVNRWLLAFVAADIVTMAVGLAYSDILLRIADSGRKKGRGANVAIAYHELFTKQLAKIAQLNVQGFDLAASLGKIDDDVLAQAFEQHAGGETLAGVGVCAIRKRRRWCWGERAFQTFLE